MILELSHVAEILQNVQSACELREDQNLIFLSEDFLQQFIDQHKLTTCLHEMLSKLLSILRLNSIKQIRMVADFPELHHFISIKFGI